MSIKGIDISNNDGVIDFTRVAKDGVNYVYVKATEGQSFQDSYMDSFFQGCKNNDLKVGAYHFLVGTSSPEAQATNFYAKIKDYEWDLVPMMDIETNFEGLSDYVIRFINAFRKLSPLELGIYSYTSFIDYIKDIDNAIKDMPFWEANYNNDPWNLSDNFFTNRVGHQYTETGSINGVNTKCDVNEFNEGIFMNTNGYVVTTYLPNGYQGDNTFNGVDADYVLQYFKDVRCYFRGNEKGVWIETQILPMNKCLELKSILGSWFYSIETK